MTGDAESSRSADRYLFIFNPPRSQRLAKDLGRYVDKQTEGPVDRNPCQAKGHAMDC